MQIKGESLKTKIEAKPLNKKNKKKNYNNIISCVQIPTYTELVFQNGNSHCIGAHYNSKAGIQHTCTHSVV